MVTIKQVAKKAGVSPTTASYALNNRPEVKESTKQKVLEAARALNYVQNKTAQSLRSGRTNTFTVITNEAIESTNTFTAEFFGILAEARSRKYDVLIKLLSDDLSEQEIKEIFGSATSDGYILLGNSLEKCVKHAVNVNANAVLLSSHSEYPIIQINSDGRSWFNELTKKSILSGKRFPVYLAYADITEEEHLRKQGYLDGMKEFGEVGSTLFCGYDIQGIEDAVNISLQQGADCFICWNDDLAYVVIGILQRKGIKIPRDVAVTGFDDISIHQDNSFLTTVHQPFFEKGRKAVDLLIKRINGEEVSIKEYFVECKLVRRKSL